MEPCTAVDVAPAGTAEDLTIRMVSADEVDAVVDAHDGSFLQLSCWAGVKGGWDAECLGWFDAGGALVGAGTVLYRRVPRTGRSLAYMPEGPCLPWQQVADAPELWLAPLAEHVRARGAFTLRIGVSLPRSTWSADTTRKGFAAPSVRTFRDLRPDTSDLAAARLTDGLRRGGWRPLGLGPGFTAGQPRYTARVPLDGRTTDELHKALSSQWRRNLARASGRGVTVRRGIAADVHRFHTLYVETASRDGFAPRPESYFHQMWHAFDGGNARSRLRLLLAELDGQPLAAALVITTGARDTYVYGASTEAHRDVRAANALHWHALADAAARGCRLYDLRGIGDTLDDDETLAGLLRFKLGLRGECVEYVGEWELPLSPLWDRAYRTLLALRTRQRPVRLRSGDGGQP